MSINLKSSWQESHKSFQQQVDIFHNENRNQPISLDRLEEIYTIVNEELFRLNELSNKIKEKEAALNQRKWCSPNSKQICRLSMLNGASKVFAIAGAVLAAFSDQTYMTWAGIGVFFASELCDALNTLYAHRISLCSAEMLELLRIDQKGVEHAQLFKTFLEELKKTRAFEERLKQAPSYPLPNTYVLQIETPDQLEDHIKTCLRHYEALPQPYHNSLCYGQLISRYIHQLPVDDPLHSELLILEQEKSIEEGMPQLQIAQENRIEEEEKSGDEEMTPYYITSFTKPIAKPIPISLLPFATKGDARWDHEQYPNEFMNMSLVESQLVQMSFRERLRNYKYLIISRLETNHPITYLQTPNGKWILCG